MRVLFVVFLLTFQLSVSAAPMDAYEFDSEAQEKSYKKLTDELRCLVCQNQAISGSNAGLAKDLRSEVHTMLQDGKTEEEIKTFMVDRYGDYVLYEPPMKPLTWLLWFGPAVIFILALFFARKFIAQQNSIKESGELSAEEEERVKNLQKELNSKDDGDERS